MPIISKKQYNWKTNIKRKSTLPMLAHHNGKIRLPNSKNKHKFNARNGKNCEMNGHTWEPISIILYIFKVKSQGTNGFYYQSLPIFP